MGVLKDQLRVNNFWFNYPDQTAFLNCRFLTSSKPYYPVWRLIWALYHTSWLITGLVMTYLDEDKHLDKWFVYLSHWVYLLLVVTCWLDVVVVVVGRRKRQSNDEEALSGSSSKRHPLKWYHKMVWCMSDLVSTGCIMVTLWYWSTEAKGKPITAVRMHYHGVNAIYVIANVIVSRKPIRLLHFVYPVIFGVLYTLFTAMYHFCGGTNQNGEDFIYKAVDWSKPQRTFIMSSISNFVFIPIVHLSLWCLSIGIEKLCSRYYYRLPRKHEQIEDTSFSES